MALILARVAENFISDEEFSAIKNNFSYILYRSDIPEGEIIIGRYSVLPYYREVEDDIKNAGSRLINTLNQHRFVADIGNWYPILSELTPKSWPMGFPIDSEGPFILKGETNSQRFKFKTHMYAKTKNDIPQVRLRLQEDSLFASQQIWVREFEKLKSYGEQVTGLPIANEFRFFVCNGKILCGGFYWSNCADDLEEIPNPDQVPRDFLQHAVDLIGDRCTFYSIDVAQREDGVWRVIELNDGQMSGLSCCDPETLYSQLKKAL